MERNMSEQLDQSCLLTINQQYKLAPKKPLGAHFTTPRKHIIMGFLDSNPVIETKDRSGQWQQPENLLPCRA